MNARHRNRIIAGALSALLLQVSVLHAAIAPSCLGHLGPMGPGLHGSSHEADGSAPLDSAHGDHHAGPEGFGAESLHAGAQAPPDAPDCGCSGLCQCELSPAAAVVMDVAGTALHPPVLQVARAVAPRLFITHPTAHLTPLPNPPPVFFG